MHSTSLPSSVLESNQAIETVQTLLKHDHFKTVVAISTTGAEITPPIKTMEVADNNQEVSMMISDINKARIEDVDSTTTETA
jgi:hypothetical protein